MKFQITKDQLIALSEGRVIRCGDLVISASAKIQQVCKSILNHSWMTKNYGIFIEKSVCCWQLYLKEVKRRRRR